MRKESLVPPLDRPRTLFEKVWDAHVVQPETADIPGILYIDLHLVHEVTSPQAFSELDQRGLKVRRPDRTYATLDHSTPTLPAGADGKRPYVTDQAAAQLKRTSAAQHPPRWLGQRGPRRASWRQSWALPNPA